jgi:hypothetical protein
MRLRWVCATLFVLVSASGQGVSGSISGTVVDATNEVPDANVTIVSPVSRLAKTDSSGRFVIERLAPGTYKLQVQHLGFMIKELGVSVEAGKETSLGRVVLDVGFPVACLESAERPRVFEKKLNSGGFPQVSGIARGEAGLAFGGFTMTLLLTGSSNVIASTSTDRSGEFQFVDVAPGIYDLEVSDEGSRLTKVRKLRVREGHKVEVRLTWTQPQFCL